MNPRAPFSTNLVLSGEHTAVQARGLGYGEELFGSDVLQFLNGATGPLDAHGVDVSGISQTEARPEIRLTIHTVGPADVTVVAISSRPQWLPALGISGLAGLLCRCAQPVNLDLSIQIQLQCVGSPHNEALPLARNCFEKKALIWLRDTKAVFPVRYVCAAV